MAANALISNRIRQAELFSAIPINVCLCSKDLQSSEYRPKSEAMLFPYVGVNNADFINVVVFDLDYAYSGAAWLDADLPPPTWIAMNPENLHCHCAYLLRTPVFRNFERAHIRPRRLLSRIQELYTARMHADRAYAGALTKTPYHDRWDTREVGGQYTLNELAKGFDLPPLVRRETTVGEGRNCTLFNDLRQWAYRSVHNFEDYDSWNSAVLIQANQLNIFKTPLKFSEIKATAKSVAKWVWERFERLSGDDFNRRFSDKQKSRIKKKWDKKNYNQLFLKFDEN